MIFEKVKEVVADTLKVDANEITLEASFQEDLDADSLDIVQLLMAFEEEFDFEIPDEEAENLRTVSDVVNYIQAHTEE